MLRLTVLALAFAFCAGALALDDAFAPLVHVAVTGDLLDSSLHVRVEVPFDSEHAHIHLVGFAPPRLARLDAPPQCEPDAWWHAPPYADNTTLGTVRYLAYPPPGPLWRLWARDEATVIYSLDATLAELERCRGDADDDAVDPLADAERLFVRTQNATHTLVAATLYVTRVRLADVDADATVRHRDARAYWHARRRHALALGLAVERAIHPMHRATVRIALEVAHERIVRHASCLLPPCAAVTLVEAEVDRAERTLRVEFDTLVVDTRLLDARSDGLVLESEEPPCDDPGSACVQTWRGAASDAEAARPSHAVHFSNAAPLVLHVAMALDVAAHASSVVYGAEPSVYLDGAPPQPAGDHVFEDGERVMVRLDTVTGLRGVENVETVESARVTCAGEETTLVEGGVPVARPYGVRVERGDDGASTHLVFFVHPLSERPAVYTVEARTRSETHVALFTFRGCGAGEVYVARRCVLLENVHAERETRYDATQAGVLIIACVALLVAVLVVIFVRAARSTAKKSQVSTRPLGVSTSPFYFDRTY